MSYRYTASIPVSLAITCEKCGHGYSSTYTFQSSASYSPEQAQTDLSKKFVQGMAGFSNVGVHKCPQCGHIQSWNQAEAQKDLINNWSIGLSFLIALALCSFVSLIGKASVRGGTSIIVFAVSFGVFFLIVRLIATLIVRRSFHKYQTSNTIMPQISLGKKEEEGIV